MKAWGNVYYRLGENDNALKYYKKALDVKEKVLGKEHTETAHSYFFVGFIYERLGDFNNAFEYYKQDLDIKEKVLGKTHPHTAISYNIIGSVCSKHNDYDKALKYHQKALDIQENILGKEHPDTVSSYNALAWTCHLMSKYEEALPWAEKAVDAFPQNPENIDTLATVYQGLRRYSEAMEQFELCLKLLKEQGATDKNIQETKTKIAELKKLMHSAT